MATIVVPSSPGFRGIRYERRAAVARTESPMSYKQQLFDWAGRSSVFTFDLPPLTTSEASQWMDFLNDALDPDNTFSISVAGYVPSSVTSPMTMRLADSVISWDIDQATLVGISFRAIEAQS